MKTLTSRQVNAKRKAEGRPPLNFALFRKIIKKLEIAPEAYDQTDVAYKTPQAPCGTAACIGGWAVLLQGKRMRKDKLAMLNMGAVSLGLADKEDEDWEEGESGRVFSANPDLDWPQPFANEWKEADTRQEEADIAIRYLKQIMVTGSVD